MSYIGNQPFNTSFVFDTFTSNGTAVYALSTAAPSPASLIVTVGGILQDPSTYGVVGKTLTLGGIPPSGSTITVRYLGLPASNVTTTAYRNVTETTATAGQTTFSVASYTPGYVEVFRNGVRLATSDYTATNGTQVVLVNPAVLGDTITTIGFYIGSVLNAIPAVAGIISANYLDVGSANGTGAMIMPVGTTSQRPTGTAGYIRHNSTTGLVEFWDSKALSWTGIGAFAATGGAVSTYSAGGINYQVHTFTSSGNFAVTQGQGTVDILRVAGGGGGGRYGGGGGAGGYIYSTGVTVSAGSYAVTIGAGGAGWPGDAQSGGNGTNGSLSSFGSLTVSIGGGGGGNYGNNSCSAGASAGSGGGGGCNNLSGCGGGSGTAGQGNAGSAGSGAAYQGGGGGGAGQVGATNGVSRGGDGLPNSISGTATYYAGGGGGCFAGTVAGGLGGGGTGGDGGVGSAADAQANRGGGGGGTRDSVISGTTRAGNGGSGIVIIRYALG